MNNLQKLFDLAKSVSANAYAPYSNFHVGAAILSDSQKFYCAESGAIAAMIAGGDKKIKEILIYASSKDLIFPCGACRQRIAEFSSKETLVHLADGSGIKQTLTIEELLPYSFKEF